jgi:hypothetical protein
VDWGTGQTGSFNPKFDSVSVKSVFSVYTSGLLQLNFKWLAESGARTFVEAFGTRLREVGFPIPEDFARRFVSVRAEQWAPRVPQLTQALLKALEAVRPDT